MIDVEKLKRVKQVFYHSSCPDGTAAATIISCAFRAIPRPEFHSLQYDTDFMDKLEPREGQLFVDITPPKTRWEEWRDFGPIVLDHHGTVKNVTIGLGGVYGENETHSGAKLAFENVMMPLAGVSLFEGRELRKWEDFAELAMIRDTWKSTHPRWREACAQALATGLYGSQTLVDKAWSEPFDFDGIQSAGMALLEANDRRTQMMAEGATFELISDGKRTWKVSFFNCTEKLISDVANHLIDLGSDVAVGYFYLYEDGQQKLSVSIRTNGQASAAGIAQTFGGGGHPRAAGFRILNANSAPPSILFSYLEQGLVAVRQ